MVPSWFWVLIGLVALQRLLEMGLARRNLARVLAEGGRLVEDDGWRPIVAVHTLFFVLLGVEAVAAPWAGAGWWTVPALAVFVVGEGLRYWAIVTLGDRWNTRVVVLPGVPLVARGPYRFLRHPNYVGVVVGLAALPLAFGLPGTALVVGVANSLALRRRIAVEERALAGVPMASAAAPR